MPPSTEQSFYNSYERSIARLRVIAEAQLSCPEPSGELDDKELRVLAAHLGGVPLDYLARRVTHSSERTVKRDYLRPAIGKIGARNIVNVPRKGIERGILVVSGTRQGVGVIRKRREILELMSHGVSRGEIADVTGISTINVGYHVRVLREELGVELEEQLVMRAFQTGNIPLPEAA